jgi:excisionase family DNA binding protein
MEGIRRLGEEREERESGETEKAGSGNGAASSGNGRSGAGGVGSGEEFQIFENRIERKWLSTEEAAHFLSVSANALRIMVHRDQIPAYKFGRRLRFSVRDCQALFRKKGA